jgi:hypothetical protein
MVARMVVGWSVVIALGVGALYGLDFIRNKIFLANSPGFPGQIPYF